MKRIITVALILISFAVTAQAGDTPKNIISIQDLKVTVVNNNLVVNWSATNCTTGYWEVQASANGKDFKTVGMVMGEDPKTANAYAFKNKIGNLHKPFKQFRVVYIMNDQEEASANVSL